MTVFIVVRGEARVYKSLEEAIAALRKGEGSLLLIVEGEPVTLRLEEPASIKAEAPAGRAVRKAPLAPEPEALRKGEKPGRVALVFDQMFRGFAEILARELDPGVFEFHEILGRGLEKPIRAGRIFKWPARDDYDVLKVVEELAGRAHIVVFYTGDKRLARQAEALGLENLVVEYMPPNEFPGKESLAKKMVEAAVRASQSIP